MKKVISLAIALVVTCSLLLSCGSPQTIKICKQTIPAGGVGFPFSWGQGPLGTIATFSLNDTQCNTVNVAGLDHFNRFTESVPAGTTLVNITCNQTTTPVKFIGADSDPAFQPGDNTVTLDLNEASVTCTFVNQMPQCCGYSFELSTGQGGSTTDPVWTVNGGNAYLTSPAAGWMGLPQAQWIQPVASSTPNYSDLSGSFSYQVRFNVPNCALGHAEVSGTFAADNSATALLDGVAIPGASCPGPICFNSPQAPVTLNVPSVAPGPHVLQINVLDEGGYTGLIVSARVRRVCI